LSLAVSKGQQPPWIVPDDLWARIEPLLPVVPLRADHPGRRSLNASLAPWLLRTGRATAPHVVSKGTALGRSGRVHISRDTDGAIWEAGATVTCVSGQVEL
jgi:transposase